MPPSTEAEIRAAIATADRALGITRAVEGQPPQHVNPVPPSPAAQAFTDDDVTSWSKQLGFAASVKKGRVTTAKD